MFRRRPQWTPPPGTGLAEIEAMHERAHDREHGHRCPCCSNTWEHINSKCSRRHRRQDRECSSCTSFLRTNLSLFFVFGFIAGIWAAFIFSIWRPPW